MRNRSVATIMFGALALSACSSGGTAEPSPSFSDPLVPPAVVDVVVPAVDVKGPVNPAALDLDYCTLLATENVSETGISTASTAINAIAENPGTWIDPAAITSLHESGATVLELTGDVNAYYLEISAAADDPEVAAAFEGLAELMSGLYGAQGSAAASAATVEGYVHDFMGFYAADDVPELLESTSDWARVIARYSETAC